MLSYLVSFSNQEPVGLGSQELREMSNSPRTQLSDKIRLSNAALYERVLYLFLRLYRVEATPLSSAIGVSLFLQINDLHGLQIIYEQLDQEVGLLSYNPTDEADLPNKTLSVVAYHAICYHKGFEEHLPLSVVNSYLNYASKEAWFGMSELALFTYELTQDMQVAEEAFAYFQSNLRDCIHNKYLTLTCQGLHALRGKISSSEAITALEVVEDQVVRNLLIDELVWMLVGLTSLQGILQEPTFHLKISQMADAAAAELSARLESALVLNETDIGFQGVIHLIQSGSATVEEIQNLVQKLNKASKAAIKTVEIVDGGVLLVLNEQIPDLGHPLPISSLAYYLWAICSSGRHQIIGVSANFEQDFKLFLSKGEAITANKAVILPRWESIIINLMALLFIVGALIGLTLYGGGALTIDFSSYDLRAVDLWNLWCVIPTLVILGGISIFYTGTIRLALWELPVIKDIRQSLSERLHGRKLEE